MKINSINHSTSIFKNHTENSNSKTKIQAKAPSFGMNLAVGLASFIEQNGFMGEFLTIDTTGMGFPRAYQGYKRNSKELGHLNYRAGHEEVRRELLSGPAFFFVPLSVTLAASLLSGKAAKVPRKSLEVFRKLMKKTTINFKNPIETKKNFINTVIKESFGDYKNEPQLINELSEIMEKRISGRFSAKDKFLNLFRPKNQKVDTKAILEEKAEVILTKLNKANERFLDSADTLKLGTISNGEGKKVPAISEIKTFLSDVSNYLDDFTNKSLTVEKHKKAFTDSFHKNATIRRAITEVSSIGALSAFLYFIPKIYQTGEDFPGKNGLSDNSESEQKAKEVA